MIFKFGKKKFSDVVKVVDFLEKSNIMYEVLADIELGIGEPEKAPETKAQTLPEPHPGPPSDNDPLWKAANHDGKDCFTKGCTAIQHYGGEVL